jgi:hypothetical protein
MLTRTTGENMMVRDSKRRTGSNECFYIDENGEKSDAALHADMLGDDSFQPDPVGIYRRARALGLEDDMIRRLYHVEPPADGENPS